MESDGVTLVEPSGATAPTSGAIVNCVALVEDQCRVEESPLLMEVGSAVSVTGGVEGAAVDGGGVPLMTGFLLQPPVRTAPANTTIRQTRYNRQATSVILNS